MTIETAPPPTADGSPVPHLLAAARAYRALAAGVNAATDPRHKRRLGLHRDASRCIELAARHVLHAQQERRRAALRRHRKLAVGMRQLVPLVARDANFLSALTPLERFVLVEMMADTPVWLRRAS